MNKIKSTLIGIISVCMVITLIPIHTFASELDVPEDIVSEEDVEEQEALSEEEKREQELFEKYGDDPGNGRLAGNVPESFYDGSAMFSARASYSHNDRFKGYIVQQGIDVSHHQGKIDWKKVKAAGVQFAIIRVGYRGYGEKGNFGNDQRAYENMKAANEVGIPIGVYIFSQAITESEAVAEAEYALNKIKGYRIDLPVVMDYEFYSGLKGESGRLKDAKLSKRKATNNCLAFCKTVEEAGYDAMVYANKSYLTDNLYASEISNKYDIWLANYTTSTSYTGDYTYWQYSSTGKVNGITGNVDMNFRYIEPTSVTDSYELEVNSKTKNSVSLQWKATNELSGVSGYEVEKKNNAGEFEFLTEISNPQQLTYIDEELKAGTVYTYRIRPFSKNEEIADDIKKIYGEYSNVVTAVTGISASTSVTNTSSTFDSIKLKWKKASNVTGYQVQRYNPLTEKYVTLKKVNALSYTDKNVDVNTSYKYRIRPYKTVGNQTVYGTYSSAKNVKTGTSVTGVTTSRVNIRSGAGTSNKVLKKVNKGTKFSVKGGKGDWYKLSVGVNGKIQTGYISKDYVKIATLPAKTVLTVKSTAFDKMKLSWNKVTGADGYVIQRYNDSEEKYETIKTIVGGSAVTYINSSLNCDTIYKYRVRAYDTYYGTKVYGSYSTAVSGKTKTYVTGKATAKINLRKGAGTSYKSYKTVKKGTKLKITGSTGSWYRVSIIVGGKKQNAYVLKKYVKL